MNRAEMTRRVLLLEAASARLEKLADALRADLNADAVAEYEEQGSAQTWRFDIGTWSQPISKTAPTVHDAGLLAAWVKRRYPSEVVEIVRPAFQKVLMARLVTAGEYVVDPGSGEVVPGLGVREGGRPLTLRFKPNAGALDVADEAARELVDRVTSALDVEAVDRG